MSSSEGATSFMPPPSTGEFRSPGLGAVPETSSTQIVGMPPPASFETVSMDVGILVEERDGVLGARHQLGVHTTVGRTPDNQIVVPVREVSRKHAEISLTANGYLLRDLGSPNGTFVNGDRVSEHRLNDGDRIGFGGQLFVFKAR
jgi:hypothetical protein